MNIKNAISTARVRLKTITDIPQKEAVILLAFLLKKEQTWILTHDDTDVDEAAFEELLKRREAFEPIEYITGTANFYGLDFLVTPAVLIPRPETELLVGLVLRRIRDFHNPHIVDVGTGSGAIGCTIAKLRPDATVMCVDISKTALEVASANAARLEVADRVSFCLSDLLQNVPPHYDIVVSNPPYIADSYQLPKPVLHEPKSALFSGADGADLLKRLSLESKHRGSKLLACEMGYDQKDIMNDFLSDLGVSGLSFYDDYSGLNRGFIINFS